MAGMTPNTHSRKNPTSMASAVSPSTTAAARTPLAQTAQLLHDLAEDALLPHSAGNPAPLMRTSTRSAATSVTGLPTAS